MESATRRACCFAEVDGEDQEVGEACRVVAIEVSLLQVADLAEVG